MQLIHINPAPKPTSKKKNRKANLQEDFEKYWRLVEKRQRDNTELAKAIASLRKRYEAEVLPAEQEMNELMARECFHLMDFLTNTRLSESTQIELIEWLSSNVERLESHPYYPAEEKHKVITAMLDCLQQHLPGQRKQRGKGQKKGQPSTTHNDDSAQPNLFGDEELDELSAQHAQASEAQAMNELERMMKEVLPEEEWQEFKKFFDERLAGEHDAEDEFRVSDHLPGNNLVQPESINLLFRRLARALHPDKELDETKKAEKHLLMSQLLKAREHNDLPMLLALHRKYVTDEPLAVEEDELRGLIAMLKSQLEQLASEEQRLISEDQVNYAVYIWYYGKTPKQITRKINHHVQELGNSIRDCRYFVEQVKTPGQLRSYLRR